MNTFNISDYLFGRGFERTGDRTFVLEAPSIKIKLIHPDDLFECGYNTMAISSPKRLFPKREIEVPQDIAQANIKITPFMHKVIKLDPSMNNTAEKEGILVKKIFTERGVSLHILINGNDEPSEFRVKRSACDMVDLVEEGEMVYFIYKIESKEFDSGIRNYLNIISIHPVCG